MKYSLHVADDRKQFWVNAEKSMFDNALRAKPRGMCAEATAALASFSNAELIDTFIYGTGLFHLRSNKGMERRLALLMSSGNRAQIVFAMHSACHSVLSHAICASQVIAQDFEHWLNQGLCPSPTRVGVIELFASTAKQEIDDPMRDRISITIAKR